MVTAACVGRDREIEVLSSRLRAVSGAELLAVTGDPGSGKSTLLAHLVHHHLASPGAGATLWARVSPWQSATPGSLIRQLLQVHHAESEPADGLVNALVAATDTTDGPVLVAIDDADLADEASLHALVTLIREHRSRRILVVVTTARPGTRLAGQAFDELRLEGVDAQGTADLAEQRVLRGS